MTEPPRQPALSTFILRLTRDWSAASARWRMRIEHVQSGRHADFVGLDGLMRFLRDSGVTVEDHTSAEPPGESGHA